MTRLRHYDNLDTARFVTFSTYRWQPLLLVPDFADCFVFSLDLWRRTNHIRLLGYVVMPEHVHLVLHPPRGFALGSGIGRLKTLAAKNAKTLVDRAWPEGMIRVGTSARRSLWQRRCYDHNCRSTETVVEKIRYCHKNPVNRGLVCVQRDWRWSSYHWYHGEGDAQIDLDGDVLIGCP